MTNPRKKPSRRFWALPVVGALGLLVVGLALVGGPDATTFEVWSSQGEASPSRSSATSKDVGGAAIVKPPTRSKRVSAAKSASSGKSTPSANTLNAANSANSTNSASTSDQRLVPTAAPSLNPPSAPQQLGQSHPITPERVAMQAELAVFGALSDALSAEDPQRIRELVDQHRERFVDDPEHMRAGYSILADCLEFESAAVTARAQRFYDRERASTLRRKIRKTCL